MTLIKYQIFRLGKPLSHRVPSHPAAQPPLQLPVTWLQTASSLQCPEHRSLQSRPYQPSLHPWSEITRFHCIHLTKIRILEAVSRTIQNWKFMLKGVVEFLILCRYLSYRFFFVAYIYISKTFPSTHFKYILNYILIVWCVRN